MALQDLTMMLSFHFGLPSEPEDSQYGKSWRKLPLELFTLAGEKRTVTTQRVQH